MNRFNYFHFLVCLLGLLIFIPEIASANMVMGGFLIYSPSVLALILFLGIWIIEALVIKNILGGDPKRALRASFVINIATAPLGIIRIISGLWMPINLFFDPFMGFLFFVGQLLFLSIIIETPLLFIFYKEKEWLRVFYTSVAMNINSCLLLGVVLVTDILFFAGLIIIPIIVFFSIRNIFVLIAEGKPISKNPQIIKYILTITISIVLIFLVFLFPVGPPNPRIDSIRKSHMRQIIAAMEMCYGDPSCGGDDAYVTMGQTVNPTISPDGLATYLPTFPMKPDGEAKYDYVWVDNIYDNQKFCVYAALERRKGYYAAASDRGYFECKERPTLNDCCYP